MRKAAWSGVLWGVGIAIFGLGGGAVLSLAERTEQGAWTAPASAKAMKNPVKPDEASVKRGQAVYRDQCAVCHGEKGAGDGPMSATINPKPEPLTKKTIGEQTDGELFWKISKGRSPMPEFEKTLSERDRWHVVNYLRKLVEGTP